MQPELLQMQLDILVNRKEKMISAYAMLGVSPNASIQDIEIAYQKIQLRYSNERLQTEAGAAERFGQIQNSYRILTDPDSRAAHDRKLTNQANAASSKRIAPVIVDETASIWSKPIVWMLMLIIALFAGGGYMSYKRDEARKVVAAQELAAMKLEAEQAEKDRQSQFAKEQDKRRADQNAAYAEQRLRNDSRQLGYQAQYNQQAAESSMLSQVAAEQRDAQRREQEQKYQRDRDTQEARMRAESDKRRIRELCYQNYGKPNC